LKCLYHDRRMRCLYISVRGIKFAMTIFRLDFGTVLVVWYFFFSFYLKFEGPSGSWSYRSWIYNYLCNQWLLPLTLCFRIPLMRGVLDTTLCDKVWQYLAAGLWFFPGTPISFTNKTDCHDINEILLKLASNTITLLTPIWSLYLNLSNKPTIGHNMKLNIH
jgi:hypothetical protein